MIDCRSQVQFLSEAKKGGRASHSPCTKTGEIGLLTTIGFPNGSGSVVLTGYPLNWSTLRPFLALLRPCPMASGSVGGASGVICDHHQADTRIRDETFKCGQILASLCLAPSSLWDRPPPPSPICPSHHRSVSVQLLGASNFPPPHPPALRKPFWGFGVSSCK